MLLNYDVIFVEKVPFPVLAYLKWRTFSSTCSTSLIIMKFYQQVCSVKRSKLAKFQDDITSIDGVMTSQIIRHDVKIWWRHISMARGGRGSFLHVWLIWKYFLSLNSRFLQNETILPHENVIELWRLGVRQVLHRNI